MLRFKAQLPVFEVFLNFANPRAYRAPGYLALITKHTALLLTQPKALVTVRSSVCSWGCSSVTVVLPSTHLDIEVFVS